MVKNFDKKVWRQGCCKELAKKLWQMLTFITNCQSSINSKTKPNEAFPNIDEHNKMISIFSRICFVPCASSCCLMMARCTVESMICGCHNYVRKLLLESKLYLLKYCNIDILTSILMPNKLKCTSH